MALSTQDRLDIMELASRYAGAIDRRDGEAWAECFTDDGVMISGNGNRVEGRAALVEHMRKARESGRQVRHWGCNHIVEGDGNRARLRMYLMAVDVGPSSSTPAGPNLIPYVMGQYDDTVVRIGGRWKFRERRITFDAGGI